MSKKIQQITKYTIMVDVFSRAPGSHILEKITTWYSKLSNTQAWTLIEQIRTLLRTVDLNGFYLHDLTTDEQIAHAAIINGVTDTATDLPTDTDPGPLPAKEAA